MQKITPDSLIEWLKDHVRSSLGLDKDAHLIITAPHKLRGIPSTKSNIGPPRHYSYTGQGRTSQSDVMAAVIAALNEAREIYTYKSR